MPIRPHEAPPPPPRHKKQRALNEAWPLRDADGSAHVRGIVDQPQGIPVTVRVEWEHDGVEQIAASATRWTPTHVFCRWVETRLPIDGLWVRAADVERRPISPSC